MSDQEQQIIETTVSSENPMTVSNDQNQSSEKPKENESNTTEQCSTRRITMPQDVRYSIEQNDREKLMDKYNKYQISDTNACNIRFLTDNRQKKNLFGRNEEENSNLHSFAKTFNVNMFPGYQHTTKHSYKIFGAEANVRKCLIEIMNRMFKRSNRSAQRGRYENNNQQKTANMEKSQETEVSSEKAVDDKTSHPTSVFVTTINADSSITNEQKPFTPATPNIEKSQETEVSTDKEVDDKTSDPTSIFVTTINPDSSVTEEQKPVTPDIEKPQETEVSTDKKVDDKASDPASIFVTTINPDSSVTEEQKPVTPDIEKSQETEVSTENEKLDTKSPLHPTEIFVTTINPDASVTEEKKPITPATPNTNDDNNEQEELKFIPLERKPQYTFIMLISSQGQEVLKKNWSFFAGLLQQRLNVLVANPVKLPKFGGKQVQNELSITGELIENLTDAILQIAAFINDVLGIPIQPYTADEEPANNDTNPNYRSTSSQHQGQSHGRTFINRNRSGMFEQLILIRSDCVARIVGTRASTLKRIQTKCHLREMIVARQANDNGYVECTLTAYQIRNIHFAIDTIRSFLRNEDDSAVIIIESNPGDNAFQDSHQLPPSNTEHPSTTSSESCQTGFITKSLNLGNGNQYPQPSYNFQNTPSFDFTHQATSASRKTDKRPGELHDHNKTPNEHPNQQYENLSSSDYLSNSPKHKSKRSCPETKDIDCITDEGFWIQKQYYHVLDDTSKQLFDSLIEKLEKIRIATEENAVRKQQRLVGRNRSNKSKGHTTSISYSNEDNNQNENDLTVKSTQVENNTKVDQLNEEKENKQETSTVIVSQD